jgi:hypothetical protein
MTNKPNDTEIYSDSANSQNTLFRTTPYQYSLTTPVTDKSRLTQKGTRSVGKVVVVKTITVSTGLVSTNQQNKAQQEEKK